MPRLKSFLPQLTIDQAQRSHCCRFSKRHPIKQGDYRLTMKDGRDVARYCPECALRFLLADSSALSGIIEQLQNVSSPTRG